MPIRSHKMPRAYLQQFATSANRKTGRLCVYERGRKPRIGTPKNESVEPGFFTSRLTDGSYSDGPAEKWAQKIEDRATLPLKHAANPCFVWTKITRMHMAEYWALMFVRATAAFEFHRNSWKRSLSEVRERICSDAALRAELMRRYSFLCGRPISEEELLGIYSRVIPGLCGEAELRSRYVERLRYRTSLLSSILLRKPWQVWLAPNGCEFVTCDSPVMTLRFDNWGRYYIGEGFGKDGVAVLLPISPQACLVAGMQGCPSRTIDRHDLWEVNKVIISSSVQFVYSKTLDERMDRVVQEHGGSIRYGVDAFSGNTSDQVIALLQ